jgi:hypothetical protein
LALPLQTPCIWEGILLAPLLELALPVPKGVVCFGKHPLLAGRA